MLPFSLGDDEPEEDDNWSYKATDFMRGPQNWHLSFKDCGGRNQSPININKANVIYDPCLHPLDFSEYKSTCPELRLVNAGGHTAQVNVYGEILLKGGGLSGMYGLDHVHFHWGKNDKQGSEHSVKGKHFPLEVHFCHLLLDCARRPVVPNQWSVVTFFIKVGAHNEKYEQLLRYFDKIRYPGNEIHIPTFQLHDLLPVSRRFDYYRYHGSLTSPPCSETVTWSVGINRIFMSKDQMERFRTLFGKTGLPMVDTFRPIQDLNGRAIYTNSKRYANGTVKKTPGANC